MTIRVRFEDISRTEHLTTFETRPLLCFSPFGDHHVHVKHVHYTHRCHRAAWVQPTDNSKSDINDAQAGSGGRAVRTESAPTAGAVTELGADTSKDTPDLENIPSDKAVLAGRVVNQEGMPLEGLRVLCCSHNICYQDETGDDGRYLIADIDIDDVYKMQAADPTKTYTSVYFYQAITGGEYTKLEGDIILQPRDMTPIPWAVEGGGSVQLANDTLELTAQPGSLTYPTGLPEEIAADPIAGTILPPYKGVDWTEKNETLIAFVFNPAPIGAMSPVGLKISSSKVGEPGDRWTIWSLNPDTAVMESVGEAVVEDNGDLVSADDALLQNLNTIVLEPK